MYIGEIARLAGTSPKALRHYEALGLLGDVRRSGAYRVYTQQDLAQVKLIRQAQVLGFRLAELLPVLAGDDTDWAALSQHIAAKRAQVQHDIARLRQLDAQLADIDTEIGDCLARQRLQTMPGALAFGPGRIFDPREHRRGCLRQKGGDILLGFRRGDADRRRDSRRGIVPADRGSDHRTQEKQAQEGCGAQGATAGLRGAGQHRSKERIKFISSGGWIRW